MILLDTNAVLWALNDDPALGRSARRLIANSAHRFLSAVSHVELTVKAMKGKLSVPVDLPTISGAAGFEPLPLQDRHVAAMRDFPSLVSHDPFDRMLLAQAKTDGLAFLTSDRVLLALDEPWIIDATR